jgi:hypothetical protein
MLVVVLSDGDRRNPIFDQIATVIENANQEVVEVMAGGQKFRFRDYQSGQLRLFVTRIVKKSIAAGR